MTNSNPSQQSVLNNASKDKFILVLDLPAVLKPEFNIDVLEFKIFGTIIPAIQTVPHDAPFGGQSYNVTGFTRPPYQPLTVNYVVDNRFSNWYILWKWIDLQNTAMESLYGGSEFEPKLQSIKEYQSTFTTYHIDEYNQKTLSINYTDVFPIMLGSVEYSYRDPTQLESSVTFQFNRLLPTRIPASVI